MKLLNLSVSNFGSYETLSFDFTDTGLVLIHGPTGAGKSTIMDAASWCLFGITARGGSVDEVKSWSSEGLTTGEIMVDVGCKTYRITRIRGKGAQNDLYWTDVHGDEKGEERRGKDIPDTQRLIESCLGISSDQYFTGAYFSEFSPTSTFFLDKPKARREVFENIADLSFPVRLAEKISDNRKVSKKELEKTDLELSKTTGALDSNKAALLRAKSSAASWEVSQKEAIDSLGVKSKSYEADKQKRLEQAAYEVITFDEGTEESIQKVKAALQDLKPPKTLIDPMLDLPMELKIAQHEFGVLSGERCGQCGGAVAHKNRDAVAHRILDINSTISALAKHDHQKALLHRELHSLETRENPYKLKLDSIIKEVNPYPEALKIEMARINPHTETINRISLEIEALTSKGAGMIESKLALEVRIAALTHLYELSYTLRARLLTNAVMGIQDATNKALATYFDSALTVEFKMVDSDSLEVSIEKEGNPCTYRQLSKGQRGLLKLAFICSIMQAASDSYGIHFETLFFDEALSGLDSNLKSKAYRLFQDLQKTRCSVLVIEHDSEFQSLFDKKYEVKIEGDSSVVEKTCG